MDGAAVAILALVVACSVGYTDMRLGAMEPLCRHAVGLGGIVRQPEHLPPPCFLRNRRGGAQVSIWARSPPCHHPCPMIGEYSNVASFVPGHEWQPGRCASMKVQNSSAEMAKYFIKMAGEIEAVVDHVSASVYTQSTDIEDSTADSDYSTGGGGGGGGSTTTIEDSTADPTTIVIGSSADGLHHCAELGDDPSCDEGLAGACGHPAL